jgi:uncharacterized membrane protein
MYCPRCKVENRDEAQLCGSCSWVLTGASTVGLDRKYFNFSDVLSFGWRIMKTNFWFFVGIVFVFLIVIYLPAIAILVLRNQHLPKASDITLGILLRVLGWLISIVVTIGLVKIALSFCDGRKPPFATLFDAWDCFWRIVGATVLYILIVSAGIILLIVPGIVWAVKFSLCYYFIIDKGLGPVEALKASSRTTMGVKWRLFGFGILCALINLLGMLCLLVGVFATYPTVLTARALVYRQLSAQTPELAEFGIAVSSVEPDVKPLQDERKF